jgi:hypothetical protein
MLYKRQYGGKKKQKNKKTMLSISFSKTLRERNVVSVTVTGYSQPMESIIHGIKPEPSKQSLVNERGQSMKEPKRKDKHFSLH